MIPQPDDQVITVASTPVVALTAKATLRQAAEQLAVANIGVLILMPAGHHPVAILSERDVVRALAHGADPDEIWAADVATEEPRYATPGESIRSVGREMAACGVRHLAVMEEGNVVGIVSARDVLSVLANQPHPPPVPIPIDGRAVEQELAHPGG